MGSVESKLIQFEDSLRDDQRNFVRNRLFELELQAIVLDTEHVSRQTNPRPEHKFRTYDRDREIISERRGSKPMDDNVPAPSRSPQGNPGSGPVPPFYPLNPRMTENIRVKTGYLERSFKSQYPDEWQLIKHGLGPVLGQREIFSTQDWTDSLRKRWRHVDLVFCNFPLLEEVQFVKHPNVWDSLEKRGQKLISVGESYWTAIALLIYGDASQWIRVKAEHLVHYRDALSDPDHPKHDYYTEKNSEVYVRDPKGPRVRASGDDHGAQLHGTLRLNLNFWDILHLPGCRVPEDMLVLTADIYKAYIVLYKYGLSFKTPKRAGWVDRVYDMRVYGAYNNRHMFLSTYLDEDGNTYQPMIPNKYDPVEFTMPRIRLANTKHLNLLAKLDDGDGVKHSFRHPAQAITANRHPTCTLADMREVCGWPAVEKPEENQLPQFRVPVEVPGRTASSKFATTGNKVQKPPGIHTSMGVSKYQLPKVAPSSSGYFKKRRPVEVVTAFVATVLPENAEGSVPDPNVRHPPPVLRVLKRRADFEASSAQADSAVAARKRLKVGAGEHDEVSGPAVLPRGLPGLRLTIVRPVVEEVTTINDYEDDPGQYIYSSESPTERTKRHRDDKRRRSGGAPPSGTGPGGGRSRRPGGGAAGGGGGGRDGRGRGDKGNYKGHPTDEETTPSSEFSSNPDSDWEGGGEPPRTPTAGENPSRPIWIPGGSESPPDLPVSPSSTGKPVLIAPDSWISRSSPRSPLPIWGSPSPKSPIKPRIPGLPSSGSSTTTSTSPSTEGPFGSEPEDEKDKNPIPPGSVVATDAMLQRVTLVFLRPWARHIGISNSFAAKSRKQLIIDQLVEAGVRVMTDTGDEEGKVDLKKGVVWWDVEGWEFDK